jgi:cobalt-zinc-cadmium efflux system outer membrane protein
VGLLLLAGCLYPAREKIDLTVCDLAAQPRDLQPLTAAGPVAAPKAEVDASVSQIAYRPPDSPDAQGGGLAVPWPAEGAKPETRPGDEETPKPGAQPGDQEKKVTPPIRLRVPNELLPGGPVPPIDLKRTPVDRLYPPLPPLGQGPKPVLGPQGRPLTLSDLQRLALSNSPQVRQAAANVQAMRGAAIQAGLPPNPTVGFEADTFGTTGGAGYQGAFVDQVIKTANKLQLARAVATMDLRNAELALRRAETDLMSKIRGGYFAVLVAREGMRINEALVRFTTEVYTIQVEQVRKGGFAAPYEPMYLRVLAAQARAALVQARNRYVSAWKQLAAAMGLPGMCPTELAGRVDMPIPLYCHKDVLAHVLARHTDVHTALNTHLQAKLNLKVAQVTPIPDVELRVLAQRDYTGPPFAIAPSLQVSAPIPVWNRNQGGILQAQANVVQTSEEPHRVRSALSATLADAFERYETNRLTLEMYRNQILPDAVRVYRGVYERYQKEPAAAGGNPPNLGDVVVAQQTLAGVVGTYLTTLGLMWQAVVDVTDLLQTNDLFQVTDHPVPTEGVPPVPDLEHLPGLPCCHPCSPLPEAHQKVVDGTWPPALPDGGAAGDKEAGTERLHMPRQEGEAPPAPDRRPMLLPPLTGVRHTGDRP